MRKGSLSEIRVWLAAVPINTCTSRKRDVHYYIHRFLSMSKTSQRSDEDRNVKFTCNQDDSTQRRKGSETEDS